MSVRADVIMPIRNGARYLLPALISILADQALGTLIIIDDGSADDWEEIAAKELASPSVLIVKQKPAGITAALNRGLATSNAKYVARMDADDVSHFGRLAAQITFLEANPAIAAVGTQVDYISALGDDPPSSHFPCDPETLHHELFGRGRCAVIHSSVMLRRDAVIAAGGYRQAYLHAEDYDLWLRLAEKRAVANLGGTFLSYRLHAAQVSQAQRVRQCFTRDLALLAARERAAGKPDPTRDWLEARAYEELTVPTLHPTIRQLAAVYDAIERCQLQGKKSLSADAVRAIPTLARQSFLGETRRQRYDLIKRAGAQALRAGHLRLALAAFTTLAHCRAADSKLFRNKPTPGVEGA